MYRCSDHRTVFRRGGRFALLLAGLMLLPMAAQAQLPADYRVSLVTHNYPPFSISVNGKDFARKDEIKGIDADFVQELFKRAKIQYRLAMRYPYGRIYEMVKTADNSGFFPIYRKNSEIADFKWVGPIAKTKLILYSYGDKKISLKSVEQSAQYRVGVYEKSEGANFLAEHGIPYSMSLSPEGTLDQLVKGEVDLGAFNEHVLNYLADQKGIGSLKPVKILDYQVQYIAFNLNTPDEVIDRLNKLVKEIYEDGTKVKIKSRYLKHPGNVSKVD